MKLLFLYTRFDRTVVPDHFRAEGPAVLLGRLVETGVLETAEVFVEKEGPIETCEISPGFFWRAGPLPDADRIDPGTVLWVRGGFKPWIPFIETCRGRGLPILFYGAATGRERWPFWDVILDDLSGRSRVDDLGRRWVDYRKPVNQALFKPLGRPKIFDLMIGASFVHDKKGQWLAVQALIEYQRLFGKKLKAVLPGSFRRGEKTGRIPGLIRKHRLDVALPGMVPREELAVLYDQSRIFVHLGGGQVDRSVIEALACDVPVLIGRPGHHPTWVRQAPNRVASDLTPTGLAREIHQMLNPPAEPGSAARLFIEQADLETRTLPMMTDLLTGLGGGS